MLRARTWTSTQHHLRALLRLLRLLTQINRPAPRKLTNFAGEFCGGSLTWAKRCRRRRCGRNSAAIAQCDAFRRTKRSFIAANSRVHRGSAACRASGRAYAGGRTGTLEGAGDERGVCDPARRSGPRRR